MTCSEARQLQLAARGDLRFSATRVDGRPAWTAKDAWTGRYYLLGEEEYFILNCLGPGANLNGIVEAFARRFAPRRISADEVLRFAAALHAERLVVSRGQNQADVLLSHASRHRWRSWIAALANPLAIRLPGFAAGRLFSAVSPWLRWCFARETTALCAIIIVVAFCGAMVQLSEIVREAASATRQLTASHLVLVLAAISLAKICHELGHGAALHHYGGYCHEAGLMFLVFSPCLYCNVSDAWMLSNRFQRCVISFAGIWVELCLAAVAYFVWNVSAGLVHDLALFLLIVCSLNTILINGNPLMRYDGYYLLSDLWNCPNLAQQSWEALKSVTPWGKPPFRRPFIRHRGRLACYALASSLYRMVVFASIFYVMYRALVPRRMELVVMLMAMLTLVSLSAPTAERWVRQSQSPRRGSRRGRAVFRWVAGLVAAGALFGLLHIAWPANVYLPARVVPADPQILAAPADGRLEVRHRYGDWVEAGDVVARLANPALDAELQKAIDDEAAQRAAVQLLRVLQAESRVDGPKLPEAEARLAGLRAVVTQLRSESEAREIRATISGWLLPPGDGETKTSSAQFRSDFRRPLDPEYQGTTVRFGQVLGQIAPNGRAEVLAVATSSEVARIVRQQPVAIRLRQLPDRNVSGKVAEISNLAWDNPILQNMSSDSRADSSETEQEIYLVRIDVPSLPRDGLVFGSGHVRIGTSRRSIAQRARQWLYDYTPR